MLSTCSSSTPQQVEIFCLKSPPKYPQKSPKNLQNLAKHRFVNEQFFDFLKRERDIRIKPKLRDGKWPSGTTPP